MGPPSRVVVGMSGSVQPTAPSPLEQGPLWLRRQSRLELLSAAPRGAQTLSTADMSVLPGWLLGPSTRLIDLVTRLLPESWRYTADHEATEVGLRDTDMFDAAARGGIRGDSPTAGPDHAGPRRVDGGRGPPAGEVPAPLTHVAQPDGAASRAGRGERPGGDALLRPWVVNVEWPRDLLRLRHVLRRRAGSHR